MQDLIKVKIDDITQNAEGVGHIDGLAVFVPETLIGDLVLAKITKRKKNYLKAKPVKLLEKSPYRRDLVKGDSIDLAHAPLLNFEKDKENAWKLKVIKDDLKRIAKLDFDGEIKLSTSPEFHYRNKANLKINKENFLALSKRNSNDLVRVDGSYLFQEEINQVIKTFNEHSQDNKVLEKYSKNLLEVLIRANRYGQTLVVLLVDKLNLKAAKEILKSLDYLEADVLAISKVKNREHPLISNKIYYASKDKYLVERILDLEIKISPASFLQVNNFLLDDIYAAPNLLLKPERDETILDLYSGIGISTLDIARDAKKVIGVEVNPSAIKDAKANAKKNQIKNVEFIEAKAEDVIIDLVKHNQIKKAYVDPPRKGLAKSLVETINQSEIKSLVYMSCNPATYARDLKLLKQAGFRIKYLELCNQFVNTTEIELISLLERE